MNHIAIEFERRLLRLTEVTEADGERNRAARALLDEIRDRVGCPFVIDDRVWFLYHGSAERVVLAGDWTFWQMTAPFERVEGTDLFYMVLEFSPSARLQYKIVVDGEWMLDPENSRRAAEGFGVNSEFWMPEYVDRSRLEPPSSNPRRGTVEAHEIMSMRLGERRRIVLYTPDHDFLPPTLPLLVVHDGDEALNLGRFHIILDHLIETGEIAPCCALFVPPHDRTSEYATDERFIPFCLDEAIPAAVRIWRDRGISISETPRDRCVTGASLGGLVATRMSLASPDSLGSVIAQSPAYWVTRGAIFQPALLKNALDGAIVLQTGTICDAHELTGIMYRRLTSMGIATRYFEYDQGHTWGNWRSNLADALLAWNSLRAPGYVAG